MKLNKLLNTDSIKSTPGVTESELKDFVDHWCVLLPDDLKNYFRVINGTAEEYDDHLFQFNSLSTFLPAPFYFKDWIGGVPDYSKWATTKEADDYFIFANYQFHLFSYGIKLSPNPSITNTIKIFCGEDSKEIANSFSEFVEFYLEQADTLFF